MQNIIIDTNILIYTFENKEFLSKSTAKSVINLFKHGSNYQLIVTKTKMFEELIKTSKDPDNFRTLLSMIRDHTASDKSMTLCIFEKSIDKEVRDFVKNGKWIGNKKKDPIKERISGDPNVIYTLYKHKVNILCTYDIELAQQARIKYQDYFNEISPKVYDINDWKQQDFDICKELDIKIIESK